MDIYKQFENRCECCVNLTIDKNKEWHCQECFGQLCKNIDSCPLSIDENEIQEITQKAKENKVKNVARSKEPKTEKQKKQVERKPDLTKENFISQLMDFIKTLPVENVQNTKIAKWIEFDFNGEHFKIDLIRQNKGKKK